ncbi:hypothetical protein, partial [Actinomadura sp. RB99]|uniref:hypothetical protein n=1 Tax=Actinomadura sp. RB99 TaxID=2691577 RepID=UPI0019D5F221
MADRTGEAAVVPVAARETWAEVMERAGYQCECSRSGHGHGRGRCEHAQGPGVRLIAGPVNPGPDVAADMATTNPADMVAWCP